ncbi:hypothetical protein KVT40_004011 [Elsinoe batatas]|uniref:Uncharacterized protein n=1 Tax=Elsinoe batatas TaxID=2601811 RepID=A0A8K0PI60_9PEZI|nr:hypothetical protein KVT40_004011 [Elsinoe batatas]
MAPARGSRKTVVISDDEDPEDILSDDEFTPTAKPESPLKALKDINKNGKKTGSVKSSPKKKQKTTAGTDAVKSKGTIFSFFNAATQKQQSSSQPSTPPKHSQTKAEDLLDTIEDGDGDVSFINGSRTALAARKRKQDDTAHLFDAKAYGSATGSQKFRKTAGGAKVVVTEKESDRRPWMERFGPASLEELAVHNKKVKDVRALLEESLSARGRPRLIVLKGSAGTGKTTTIQLLAKSMDLGIKEWRNPVNVDIGSESFISTSAQFEDFVLRSSKFSGLDLTSASAMPTTIPATTATDTDSPDRQHILLIEEFPVSMTRSSPILQAFRTTIQAYLSLPNRPASPHAPIVLVLSETLLSSSTASPDTLTPHRLLGPTLLSHPLTAVVEFNPIAPTLLTKALSMIATKESRVSGRRRTPGPAVLSRLAEMGDIRSAVSALEFLCLKGDSDGDWSAKVTFGKAKASAKTSSGNDSLTDKEREALKLVGGREGALGLWHAVGKVVYNKRIDRPKDTALATNGAAHLRPANGTSKPDFSTMISAPQPTTSFATPPPHLSHLVRPKIPENDPTTLLLELGTDISTFVASVHENLPLSCTSTTSETTLASLDECLSVLSDADTLSVDRFSTAGGGGGYGTGTAAEGLRQEEIVFHTAVRGCVFWLPYPVKREREQGARGGNVMAWPRSLRVWRGREEVGDLVELVGEEYRRVLQGVGKDGGGKAGQRDGDGDEDGAGAGAGAREGGYPLPSARGKAEVLLEMAPYLRMVHEGRKTIGSLRERVRRVTRFETLGGIGLGGAGVDGEEDEEQEDEGLGLRRERRTRTGKGGNDAAFLGGGVEDDVKGLVLSDDDIVD